MRKVFQEYQEKILGIPSTPIQINDDHIFTPTKRRNAIFSVWGSRTLNNWIISGHNLNWVINSGISKEKLITIYIPTGKNAFVTTGFAGLWGTFSGMASNGLTILESESPSKQWKDEGLPWILKQRYILENAKSRSEAVSMWSQMKNTFGFNHIIASTGSNRGATVLESIYGHTASLSDNDARERDAEVGGVRIG